MPRAESVSGYSIVYQRPDGWWEAGNGWDTADDAVADGNDHEWRGRAWGVVSSDVVEEIDGDRRCPLGTVPPVQFEGNFHG